MSESNQDWITGRSNSLMLNTDLCLVYDIDDFIEDNEPCCTKTDDRCFDPEAAKRKCPVYSRMHSRWEAREAVQEMLMLDDTNTQDRNLSFYMAFAEAWGKATTVGQDSLSPLVDSCDALFK